MKNNHDEFAAVHRSMFAAPMSGVKNLHHVVVEPGGHAGYHHVSLEHAKTGKTTWRDSVKGDAEKARKHGIEQAHIRGIPTSE